MQQCIAGATDNWANGRVGPAHNGASRPEADHSRGRAETSADSAATQTPISMADEQAWDQQTYQAAKQEGKVTVYGFWNPDAERVTREFLAEHYPGVELETLTTTTAIDKIRTELQSGQFLVDAYWTRSGKTRKLIPAVRNTIYLAAGSATLGVLLTLFTAYISQRTRLAGRGLLDLLTWIPVTVPGIVLAVGLIWASVGLVRLPFPFYGTISTLIIAVTITMITTGARTMNGSMVQLSPELEEAARIHAASFAQTIRRVLLPLMTPQNELWTGGQPEVAAALGTLNMLFSIVLVFGYSLLLRRVTAR